MNEFLKTRLDRKLESLSDDKVYQVLDYIEFLESKYGAKPLEPSAFQKLAETVEDTLRAGRVSAAAIKGTMDAMSSAGRVMSGLAAAGKSVVDQVAASAGAKPGEVRLEPGAAPPAAPQGTASPEKGGTPPESASRSA